MRRWILVVVLAGEAMVVGGSCGSSPGEPRKDAGTVTDAPISTGGVGSAGITSGTGGLNTGGAVSGGSAGTAVSVGGARTGGVIGTAGIGTGGFVSSGGLAAGGAIGGAGAGAGGTAAGGKAGATSGGGGTAAGGTTGDAGATGGTSGLDGGQDSTYSGCMYIGGIDRATVAKFDPQTGTCAAIVLRDAGRADAGAGLTISQGWGVESITLWPSTENNCAQRFAAGVSATSASGSVSVNFSSSTIDVDAVLSFPATDAGPARTVELKAQGVDIQHGC